MFFTKFPHRANFSFASEFDPKSMSFKAGSAECLAEIDSYEGDVYRIRVTSKRFHKQRGLTELMPPQPAKGRLVAGPGFELEIPDVVCSPKAQAFGVSGEAYMFQFAMPNGSAYYGMGEKIFGRMELSGLRSKFWNTDVWSDFHFTQWLEHPSDPPYLSVPYVIVKHENTYSGFLLNSSWPVFMETPGNDDTRVFVEWQRTSDMLTIGAEGGTPELWIIVGPTLKELTRKLQKLVGTTPVPPLWSLGYHQSRWEYGSEADLLDLDQKFTDHKIPCDGLWLDIDYMSGYRVFTVNGENFPSTPLGFSKVIAKNRRRMVPILDPGVKNEPGYSVFDDGVKKDIFCKNTEGNHFVGLVWPGETVFPDFTIAKGRKWWSDHVCAFAKSGFEACWIDMNDPSTGPVDPSDMLFNNGREPHAMHRNEYSLGMQMATFDGFRRARPTKRPFILSRSGFIGTSKYSAIWTGDNVANYFYLRASIPTTLNLSLSGIPFNGPDCGGFGGDPSDQLMLDWFKAGFLFPVLRNHSMKDSRMREPWNFSGPTSAILRKYIRLRYTLLPYLYNLFIAQEELGDPILRPLAYEFSKADMNINDAFLVGDSILQAPIVDEKLRSRTVPLPGGSWMDANTGDWLVGDHTHAKPGRTETPLFLRNGAIVPTATGTPTTNKKNLRDIELMICIDPSTPGKATYTYHADDGETYAYQKGKRSTLFVEAEWDKKELRLNVNQTSQGFGVIKWKPVIFGGPAKVTINGVLTKTKEAKRTLTGGPLPCCVVG